MLSTRSSLWPVMRSSVLSLALVFAVAACDSVEDRVAAHFERAQELMAEGSKPKALLEFRNALKLNSDHAPSHMALGRVAEEEGNLKRAFGHYKRVTEIDREHFAARVKVTRYLILSDNMVDAATSYGFAKSLRPNDTETYVLEAAIALNQDRLADARSALDLALAQDPANVDANLLDVNYFVKSGMDTKALARADKALAKTPDNIQLNTAKLQILRRQGNEAGVGAQLNRMAGLYPDNIRLLEAYARWASEAGETAVVEATLRDLATLQIGDRNAAFDLVRYVRTQKGDAAGREELTRLIGEVEDPFELRLMLARYEEDTGNRDDAYDLLRQLAGADDVVRANKARVAMARSVMRSGDRDKGLAIVQDALAADPAEVEAIVLWAAHLIEDGQLDEAIPFVRSGLNEAPEDVRLLLLSGQLQERLGNTDLATDRMARAVRIRDYHPDVVEPYVQFLGRIGRDQAVETILAEANSRHPNSERILDQLGFIRAKLGDWDGASRAARQLSQTNPGRARQLQAAILIGQERFDEGASLLRDLPEDQRQRAASIAALVQTYIRNGETDRATEFLDGLLKDNPDNFQALGLRGNLYLASGDRAAAIAAYQQILTTDPSNTGARSALARTYQMAGNLADAEGELLLGLEVNPDNLFLKTRLAQFRELLGNFASAIELYSDVQEQVPNSLLITNNLASLLADHRSDDQVSVDKAYELASRLRTSEFPHYHDTYGWTRYLRGEHEEALKYIKFAVEGLPQNPYVHYHLGKVYLALERPNDARKHLQKAADLGAAAKAFPPMQDIETLLIKLKDS